MIESGQFSQSSSVQNDMSCAKDGEKTIKVAKRGVYNFILCDDRMGQGCDCVIGNDVVDMLDCRVV